jgi:anti-sigma factor RsiW
MKIDPCKDPTLLSALLDGELSTGQSAAVRRHMDRCDACRRQYDLLERSDAMVRGMAPLAPSADFDRAFWQKVADLEDRRTGRYWLQVLWGRWRPALIAGVTATAAAAVIFVMAGVHRGPTPEEVFIAQNMELLENFEIIDHLEMLEQLNAVETMEEPS